MACASPVCPRGEPGRRRDRGFTLIELLVVMGILGVLMGMGVGMLSRGNTDLDLAVAIFRDQCRVAALAARTRHLPTEVVVAPGVEGGAPDVFARILSPVGDWHLEPGQRFPFPVLEPQLGGIEEAGRFGAARRHDATVQRPLLQLRTGKNPVFDLRDGFALRIDVRFEAREAMTIVRLGTGLELTVDGDLVPAAKIVLRGDGGQPAGDVRVAGTLPLRRDRWTTLELAADGRELMLRVDGSTIASAAVTRSLYQAEDDVLLVSPDDEPVIGLVDEVRLLRYELEPPQALPLDVVLEPPSGPIRFDRNGEPADAFRFALQLGDDRRELRVGPGGVLE